MLTPLTGVSSLPITITPEPRGGAGRAQLAAPPGTLTPLDNPQATLPGMPDSAAADSAAFGDRVRAQLAAPSGPLTPLGPVVNAPVQTAGNAAESSKAYLLGSRAGSRAPDVKDTGEFWGKDGFQFSDLIDIINPLQHIPVLSGIYRSLTGDEISPGARIIGGGILGGGLGLMANAMGVASEQGGTGSATTQMASLSNAERESQIASLRSSSNPNRHRQIAALQSYQQNQMLAEAQAGKSKVNV